MPDPIINSGSIAFLGFGEAARAFLDGWRTNRASRRAFPPTTSRPICPTRKCGRRSGPTMRRRTSSALRPRPRRSQGPRRCSPSSPPTRRTKRRWRRCPAWRKARCSSTAIPARRRPRSRTATEVEAAGGRYVDVAVMAPVHPRLHRTPLLISGPHVEAAAPALAALGMSASIHEGPVGAASSVKMIRSIMMKGLEALVCECVLAGRKAGVIETVLEFARRHLSRLRLEEALGLYARAGDDPWRQARRGNARSRADRRSAWPQGRDVPRLCRLAAGDRRTRFALERSGRLWRARRSRILAELDSARALDAGATVQGRSFASASRG